MIHMNDEGADTTFRLRIYRKSELAQMYFPDASRSTALQNLSRWIERCKAIREGLAALGYDKHRQYFLRPEVELIVRYLGEP